MDKTNPFKKTGRQREAIDALAGPHRHVMLYGGSRSGKTFILIYALILRAIKTESRHLVVRQHFNHAKTAIWMDTLPKVLRLCFPELDMALKASRGWNNSDYFIKFPNGSELWVGGLDNKERTEKILGKEYSTIFFNECSQLSYQSVTTALTRLAQKNDLVNKAYYDENPPTKSHWSYSVFIMGMDPDEWKSINTSKYVCMLMNPQDNIENIDESYISDILDELPQKQRERFRDGMFADAAVGAIYHSFNQNKNVMEFDTLPLPVRSGMDFNVDPMTSVQAYITSDNTIYVFNEIWQENSNTPKMGKAILDRFGRIEIIPDSTGKARKTSSKQTDHQILKNLGLSVIYNHNPFREDRFNCVNDLLDKQKIIIHPRCRYLIRDLEQLTHDNIEDKKTKLGHISDALGYLCWKYFPLKKHGSRTIEVE